MTQHRSLEFPILDVTEWAVTSIEPGGSDEKVWLIDPSGVPALFKPNRAHLNTEQGEDWAEKLVAEIGLLVGVPAATVDLAQRAGSRGCVSYNVTPKGFELQPGAVLIDQLLDMDYDPYDRKARGHTLPNIARALKDYGVPPQFTGPPEIGAFGVFAGYLLLDALVANRDRHSENWAVLRSSESAGDRLAPSYDHASALGFNLRDARRASMLRDPRMLEAFLQKGDAYRFERGKGTSLVDHCLSAFDVAGGPTRRFWLGRLDNLDVRRLSLLAASVPTMSDQARNLAVEVLVANRRRLLDG